MTRRVCFFTGARSDYGHMRPVIRAIRDDVDLDLQVLVSGGHLLEEQGSTARELLADGISVDETVEMVVAGDTASAVAKSFGLGVIGYADALGRLRPDLLLIVGDRYEALAVAVAASFRLLPIAHLGGGEVTAGATDEVLRHAISKMAHLHFTATEVARRRVIQLGEQPSTVHVTGSPAIDVIKQTPLLGREALGAELGIALDATTMVVTYHPATADPIGSSAGVRGLLQALERFPDASVVFTGTNIDRGRSEVTEQITTWAERNSNRVSMRASLGQERYVSLLKYASVVVGNSSSGLCEAPAVQTPTVNIGSRQAGRPRAASVIDTGHDADEIETAIRRALSPQHREITNEVHSPYGDGHATERIIPLMKDMDPKAAVLKGFHDLSGSDVDLGV